MTTGPHCRRRSWASPFRDRRLEASVSRLESFARCPYQHFARSLLRLQPRPEARVTPLEGGLLTHRALEVLMQQGPPPDDRKEIARRLKQVFESIEDDPSLRAFGVTPGGRLRWDAARGELARFVEIEARRLGASEFRPHWFEKPSARRIRRHCESPSGTAPNSGCAAGSIESTSSARRPASRRW